MKRNEITTVEDLERMIKHHGELWVLLVDGEPIDPHLITFGYPWDYYDPNGEEEDA